MRHRKYTFKIGRTSSHRKAMMANMLSSLFQHGKIKTTITKAKELRRRADKMITCAKAGDLHNRRKAISVIRDVDSVKYLFDEIAPRYTERLGGYTRIVRLGYRNGDKAEICYIELVEEGYKPSNKKGSPKAKKVEEIKTPTKKVEDTKNSEEKETPTKKAEETKSSAKEEETSAKKVEDTKNSEEKETPTKKTEETKSSAKEEETSAKKVEDTKNSEEKETPTKKAEETKSSTKEEVKPAKKVEETKSSEKKEPATKKVEEIKSPKEDK